MRACTKQKKGLFELMESLTAFQQSAQAISRLTKGISLVWLVVFVAVIVRGGSAKAR